MGGVGAGAVLNIVIVVVWVETYACGQHLTLQVVCVVTPCDFGDLDIHKEWLGNPVPGYSCRNHYLQALMVLFAVESRSFHKIEKKTGTFF